VPSSEVCDLTDDCGDNSDEKSCNGYYLCDFESKNLCDWRNSGYWSVGSYLNSNGPRRDHTIGLNFGNYVFLQGPASAKSYLSSPIFKPTSLCEFRVFVYMWANSNVGEFNVYSRTSSNGGDRLLLTIKTRMGQSWQKRIITLTETVAFQIIIEGLKTSDFSQIISIDDTSFDRGCVIDNSISVLPTGTTTVTTTTQNPCTGGFICPSNGQCISSAKVCNFIKDCPDASDEKNCGTCNFEFNSCGWYDGGWYVLKNILRIQYYN
jgi:hypothetical protein